MDAQVGKEGLEQAFEEQLHGVDGTRLTKVDQDGNVLEQYYDTTPQAGDNVYLTIDIDLQQAAEEALEDLILDLRENGVDGEEEGKDAEGGAMVVMDVNTGEVLASASYPTYDPATYSQDFNELLQTEYSPLLNRVLQLTYFPGSIYKMITAIAAVDYGGIGRYYEIRDKGVYTYYDSFQPKCHIYTSSGTTHGVVNMMQALSVSCNYYFYEVGRLTGIDAIDAVAAAFGLGEKTGVELPEEAGQRANPQTKKELYPDDPVSGDWYGADTLQAAIGQSENKFTPMQLASYISTLANGGTRYQATFLSKVVSSDYKQVLEEQTAQVLGQVEYSEQAHLTVEEGMRMAGPDRYGFGPSAGLSGPGQRQDRHGAARRRGLRPRQLCLLCPVGRRPDCHCHLCGKGRPGWQPGQGGPGGAGCLLWQAGGSIGGNSGECSALRERNTGMDTAVFLSGTPTFERQTPGSTGAGGLAF